MDKPVLPHLSNTLPTSSSESTELLHQVNE